MRRVESSTWLNLFNPEAALISAASLLMKTLRRKCSMSSILVLLTLSAGAFAQAQTPAAGTVVQSPRHLTTAGPNRPASVPEDYVITPNGYFHASCVKEVAQGDTFLKDQGAIQHADGSLESLSPCAYPRYSKRGDVVSPSGPSSIKTDSSHPPTPNSSTYIEYGYIVTPSSSYAGVIGQITVPPAPSASNGQSVFLFPGLEDQSVGYPAGTILQPVLGWNNFGAAAWTIASWNCCYYNEEVYSTPKNVSSGDLIIGEVYTNCPSGTLTCSTWYVSTEDAGKGSTVLSSTSNYGQTFNVAYGAALEVYSISSCSNYPSGGSTTFNGSVYDINGAPISNPAWTLVTDTSATPQCNYSITPGYQGNEFLLTY